MRSILLILALLAPVAAEQAELPYDMLARIASGLPSGCTMVMRPADPGDHAPLLITLVHGDGHEEPVAVGDGFRIAMPVPGAQPGTGCRIRANRPKGTMCLSCTASFDADGEVVPVAGRIEDAQIRPALARMAAAAAAANGLGLEPPDLFFQLSSSNHRDYHAVVSIAGRTRELVVGDGILRIPLSPADLDQPVTIQCDKDDIRFMPPVAAPLP